MRIWSFKDALSPILIIASMVTLTILILSISLGVIGTAENYKKGNNIAGGTISSYTNFNPTTHGNEKDGLRGTYLQGGWTTAGNQICTLDLENYKIIYSIYWKVGRTLWGSINETCYLYIHEIDGWHTIDEHSLGPSEGFEKELELNGQSIDEVQFYGISRSIDLQWAQWWVYEIEIYEALPWPPILVSISPISQEGAQGEMLNYTVTVKNLGTENDSYNLTVSDNENWSPTLDNNRFENVGPGENRVTTLRVAIPDNAIPGTIDNITVTATSQTDNTLSRSGSCISQVAIVREVQVVITPSTQENDNGGTLKYDVLVKNLGNVQENFQLTKGDNTGWTPTLDNTWLLVPNSENRTTKMTVNIPPNARGCTWDNLWVKATSKDDAAVFDNKSCLAHVRVIHGVDVSISPDYQENLPGGNLEYTVTVANTGNAEDTYDLEAGDDAIWSPSVSPTPLTVPSLENRTATLSVAIPSSEIGGTNDNIIVTATSQENSDVRDNASCIARAVSFLFLGTVSITLDNLYSVTVNVSGDFGTGSNLVAKFYTYGGGFQDNTLVDNENIPGHVTLSKHVSRPTPTNSIQRIDLVVTDSGGTALGTIKTWATSHPVLISRVGQINGLWPFLSEAQKPTYVSELGAINGTWPFSPEA